MTLQVHGLIPSGESRALAQLRCMELEQQLKDVAELKRLKEENGLEFYRPHAKQHKFHLAKAKGRYLRTGNRFGKSECGIVEDLAMALGGRLWYRHAFDILDGAGNIVEKHTGGHNHPYVTSGIPQRPLKILILVVNWDKAKSVFTTRESSYETWGKLWKFLPKSAIGKVTNGGRGDRVESIEIIRPKEFGGGSSTITFDTVESYKHSKTGGESDDWDVIHVDEPIPETMYKAFARGLMDRDGAYYFTCTPLDEMWINDLFCPPGQRMVKDADAGVSFERKYLITGSIYDNPYRNEAGVKEFEATLTREEKACRLYGLPLAFAGMVYREFVYDLHVLCDVPKGWENYHLPPIDYTIRVAWDVHQRIPQALLFAATAPNGDAFIYDEQYFDSLIDPNATALAKKIDGRNCVDLLIDPFAVVPCAVTGESVLDELMKYELWFEKASKDLSTGVSRVRERLAERRANGQPTIYFSPNLKQTLFEFSHYVYDTEKNEPKDKDNHMMENLYRLVLNGLDYIKPTEDGEFRSKPIVISRGEDLRGFAPRPSYLS